MRTHHTFFGKIFGTAWDSIKGFFAKEWDKADHNLLEFAVLITEQLKEGLHSGLVQAIIDGTHTDVDDNIVKAIDLAMPKILADELLLQTITGDSTKDQAEDVAKQILDSFGRLSDEKKEKFYTSIAAQLYIVAMQLKHGEHITFGQAAQMVETAYQEYQNSKV